MLETKLTTCANLLYQWLLPRSSAGGKFKIDLQDFQAWTAEYREKPFSDREVLDAIRQLKELHLIRASKTEVTLEVIQRDLLSFNTPIPTDILLTEECDRPNRLLLLFKILGISFVLGLASIGFGLVLLQTQSGTLIAPHPWSVLGDKNIGLDN
ncbi:MAG TPA: hypothetical protein V6D28_02825 [Leptolyngbyaceae cyanobacterium]